MANGIHVYTNKVRLRGLLRQILVHFPQPPSFLLKKGEASGYRSFLFHGGSQMLLRFRYTGEDRGYFALVARGRIADA